MPKLKECEEVFKFTYSDGENVYMENVQSLLENAFTRAGVPVVIQREPMKNGLLGGTEDSLVLYHPNHPRDYFRWAIVLRAQGNMGFVHIYQYGTSKLGAKAHGANALKSNGNSILGAISSIGCNKNKMAEEDNYYDAIASILADVFNDD